MTRASIPDNLLRKIIAVVECRSVDARRSTTRALAVLCGCCCDGGSLAKAFNEANITAGQRPQTGRRFEISVCNITSEILITLRCRQPSQPAPYPPTHSPDGPAYGAPQPAPGCAIPHTGVCGYPVKVATPLPELPSAAVLHLHSSAPQAISGQAQLAELSLVLRPLVIPRALIR